jgi:iron complex transport system substrate-binding protein
MSLGDVLDQIVRVGEAGGRPVAARELVSGLGRRLDSVAGAVDGLPVVPMLGLEWPDPPFTAGHWVPEMIKRAGGRDVIGVERAPSRRATWDEIAASSPEVVVNMPCGYGLDEAVELARDLYDREGLAGTPALRSEQVYAVDASGYFSRPGPRLVDGVEILASILHPDSVPLPPPGRAARVPRPA